MGKQKGGRQGEDSSDGRQHDSTAQHSNTGGHQTGLPSTHEDTTKRVGQGRTEGAHVHPHRQGTYESVTASNRESPEPICGCGVAQNSAHVLAAGCVSN